MLRPKTKKKVRAFLGVVGFCRPWIPAFGEIADPLVASAKADTEGLQISINHS